MNKIIGQVFLVGMLAFSTNAFSAVSGKDNSASKQVVSEPKEISSVSDPSTKKPVFKPGSCGEPIYPAASKRNNEEGKVGVMLRINESGNVVTAKVAVSSGFSELDEGAIAFLSRCKFEPAMKDGVPVAVWYPLYHRWTLKDAPEEKSDTKGDFIFEDKTTSVGFMNYVKEGCSRYVSSFNNNETEDTEPLGINKISEGDVCNCAEARVKADKYLKPFTVENAPDVESLMDGQIFHVYAGRKTLAILMECTAKTIEASVSKIDPRKK